MILQWLDMVVSSSPLHFHAISLSPFSNRLYNWPQTSLFLYVSPSHTHPSHLAWNILDSRLQLLKKIQLLRMGIMQQGHTQNGLGHCLHRDTRIAPPSRLFILFPHTMETESLWLMHFKPTWLSSTVVTHFPSQSIPIDSTRARQKQTLQSTLSLTVPPHPFTFI